MTKAAAGLSRHSDVGSVEPDINERYPSGDDHFAGADPEGLPGYFFLGIDDFERDEMCSLYGDERFPD